MSDIEYRGGFSAADFLGLAQRVWPRDYSVPDAAAALDRTVNIGAWDGDRLVGSVRLLTDGYFYATIPEILVDPTYRRRGIGEELMRRVLVGAKAAIDSTVQLGFRAEQVALVGIIETICLLTGYMGGAIAIQLRAGNPVASHVLFPLYVSALFWFGLYLRDPRVRALARGHRE